MTESRKIQLEAEMSTAGVKQGAQEIKATVSDMANAVSQEAGRAGQSVGKIGDGGEQTSQKVDRATKSMIQSIQRVTAQMEAGSKSSTKYYETLAQQRGVDVNVLRPYLDQLDEVQLKQRAATAALGAGSVQFDKYGMSAKQTAAAMRGVPAQLTDIFVSLQGGQRPMTVLLQQGGQLKDMFGGIVPAAQALTTTALKMVNPLMLAGAAAVGLYAAYRAGASETEAFNRTLIMTGSVAGVTADQLNTMSERVGRSVGTQRQAAAALNELAGSGKIAAASFEQFAASAISWEKATGAAVSDTIKQFEELGKAPVEASLKLNESMNYLTTSTYQQIKALQDSGRETEAAALAQQKFADAIDERAPQILAQVGSIERAWVAVKGAISGAVAAMMDIGRPETTESLNAKLQDRLARLAALRAEGARFGDTAGGAAVGFRRGSSSAAQGVVAQEAEKLAAEIQMLQQQMTAAAIQLGRKREMEQELARDSYLGDSGRQTQAQQREAAIKAEQDAFKKAVAGLAADSKEYEKIYAAHKTALINIDKQYADKKQSGGISTTQTELARLNALMEAERQREEALHSVGLAQANLNEGERLAIQYAEKLKLATDEKTKSQLAANKALAEEYGARKRANDVFEKELKGRQSAIDTARKQTLALRDQIETYGMGKSAIEELTIARLEERLAIAEGEPELAKTVEGLREEIAARKELLSAMRTKEQLDAQLKEWQAWEREVDRIFDQLGQSLTDQLFEGGVNARDLLKDLFKNMVFRVAVQPVMGAMQGWVTSQLGGMFGYQNPQQQGGGGILGLAQHASSLNTIGGGIYQALTGASSGASSLSLAYANTVGAFGGDSIGALIAANGGWEGAGAAMASGFTGAMSTAAGITSVAPGVAASLAGAGAAGAAGAGAAGAYTMASVGFEAAVGGAAAAGAGAAGAGAAGAAGAGAAGAGLGASLAAAAPWVLGGLAIASAFGLFDDGPPRTRHGQRTTVDYIDGAFGISQRDDRQAPGAEQIALAAAQGTVTAANEAFAKLGIDAAIDNFYAIMESSVLGDRDGVASGGTLRVGDELRNIGIGLASDMTIAGFGGWSDAEMLPRLHTDIQMTVLEAFQSVGDELPGVLSDMLDGAWIRGLNESDAQELAARFAAVVDSTLAFQAAVERLPFENLRDLSFDAAAGLIAAAGGLENLNAGMTSYYQTYYSEAEQLDLLSQQLSASFAAIGMEMPDVTQGAESAKQAFRALFESIDPTTEAGQQAAAVMLSVNQQFAQLVTGLEELEGAAADATNALRERESLERQWHQLNGNTAELRRRELAALDPTNRALQQRIWAIQDEADAYQRSVDAYNDAVAATNAAWATVQSVAQREIAQLQTTFSQTDSVYKALTRAIDVQRTALNQQMRASEQMVSALRGTVNLVGESVRDLRGMTTETAGMQYQQAMDVIRQAAGGQLPERDRLAEAIQSARGVAEDPDRYASAFDRDFAMLTLANELERVQQAAEPQLSVQEQALEVAREQLAKLDATLAAAQSQINHLRGIDDKTYEQTLETIKLQLAGQHQLDKLSDIDINTFVTEKLTQELLKAQANEEAARRQIEGINSQLSLAQQQLDQLRGLNTTGMSMISALNNLADAMEAQRIATPPPPPSTQAPTVPADPNAKGNRTYMPANYADATDYALANTDVFSAWLTYSKTLGSMTPEQSKTAMTNFMQQHWRQYGQFEGRKFADGGYYPGGLALVGEKGPELINFAQPGQVYTANQTQDILRSMNRAGDSGILQSILAENKALRAENKAHAQAIVQLNTQIMRILREWNGIGLPETREPVPA